MAESDMGLPFEQDFGGTDRTGLVSAILGFATNEPPNTQPEQQLVIANQVADVFGTATGAVKSGFVDEVHLQGKINGFFYSVYLRNESKKE